MSSSVFAQLALDENFDYTAADSLGSLYTGWYLSAAARQTELLLQREAFHFRDIFFQE
ncbi:MAG: hypothetical protein IPP52_13955 [Ignavibacteria bacterium]|nr:hypothetical protein [Ignavibacteria bacterium]